MAEIAQEKKNHSHMVHLRELFQTIAIFQLFQTISNDFKLFESISDQFKPCQSRSDPFRAAALFR